MSHFDIHNISFELDKSAITFSYTESYKSNLWKKAYLQLPHTPDSIHLINGIENNNWVEEQHRIFEQLCADYFNSFKDIECAAASAEIGLYINHVEKVTDDTNHEFYVAFSANDAHILVESSYRHDYNKAALFEMVNNSETECNPELIIAQAKEQYFSSLSNDLNKEMAQYFHNVICNPQTILTEARIEGCVDEILHDFMKREFERNEGNYDEDDISTEFYQCHACDIRCNFEHLSLEKLEEKNDQQ
ncbi:hypothetical protein [Legionella saoudiensis]|uniref:hypothetical protein n=1 Tax=Legionella saoudiensis TaxID=1750561 RepID=UPI000731977D|nr:hypothetical protein [Legionella saoudiensis]